MIVVYKNTGEKVENDIWREYYCEVCNTPNIWSNIALQKELTDSAGGTVYTCKTCAKNIKAKNKKTTLSNG